MARWGCGVVLVAIIAAFAFVFFTPSAQARLDVARLDSFKQSQEVLGWAQEVQDPSAVADLLVREITNPVAGKLGIADKARGRRVTALCALEAAGRTPSHEKALEECLASVPSDQHELRAYIAWVLLNSYGRAELLGAYLAEIPSLTGFRTHFLEQTIGTTLVPLGEQIDYEAYFQKPEDAEHLAGLIRDRMTMLHFDPKLRGWCPK